MRHQPHRIDRIAGKTAADLVIDAAAGHLPQGKTHRAQGRLIAAAGMITKQKFQADGVGELGLAAESAMHAVKAAHHFFGRLRQQVKGQPILILAADAQRVTVQRPMQLVGLRFQDVALIPIGLMNGLHDLHKRRQAVPRRRRIIGAAIKGTSIRQQENRHRPAAALDKGLHRLHINIIDIGTFLAVDLDIDKEFVHHSGGGRIFKALMRHHMTPMACAVADA